MSILKKPSLIVLLFFISFSFVFMDLFRSWHLEQTNFKYDVAHYYAYLPAYAYNNGSMQFNNESDWYLITSPKGKKTTKVTYGMAAMYSPFFLLGHKIASNEKAKLDGFSLPYAITIHWGSIFYCLLGMFFLRNFLIHHLDEKVTSVVLLLVFLGTNLFAYTYFYSEMSHGYLFTLFSALLYLSNSFYEKPSSYKFVILGILLGLISLIRPVDILFSVVFFLWGVVNLNEFKNRILFYLTNPRTLITLSIVVLIWVPQCLFWKENMGSYLYFSYPGENFFWNDPQIINILFSYRKGWMLYTPIVIFMFIGFLFMKKQHGRNRMSIIIIVLLIIYIYSCWWDWTFGGGFGGRVFVPYYAILALPLGAFIKWILSSTVSKFIYTIKTVSIFCLFYLMCLNIGQTYQGVIGLVHFSSMTEKSYWVTFGKFTISGQTSGDYWGSLKDPNYKDLSSGANRDQ